MLVIIINIFLEFYIRVIKSEYFVINIGNFCKS